MTRDIISLNGIDWKFEKFKENQGIRKGVFRENYDFSSWKSAKVPGNVRLDLISNKEIDVPFFGKNIKKSEWIENFEWWYQKEFEINDRNSDLRNKTVQLVFEGVDYLADFWLNGQALGNHEGMFGKIIFKLTNLKSGKNSLVVKLAPLKNFKNRFKVLKCQMSFGWDIAPKLKTSGIWDDVYLIISDKICFNSCYIKPLLNNNEASIHFLTEISNDLQKEVIRLRITIQGKNFNIAPIVHEFDVEVSDGTNNLEQVVLLKNPKLWNPWDKGKPNLYQAKINLIKNNNVIDEITDTFGIRKLEFLRNSDNPKHLPWIFQINGKKEYIRGTNWIPPDALFGRIDRERYERNLKLAKKANINLLRMWGGGIREKREFYDLCDELGLLVWQEFPIACVQKVGLNFLVNLPKNKKYLQIFKEEAESIIRELRNHPSIVLWCGGNEFHAKDNKHIIEILESICNELDPSRIFIKTCPYGGDKHNYDIWHGMGPYSRYLANKSPFCSEFGVSSYPNISSIKKFLPKKELKPFGDAMEFHAPTTLNFGAHFPHIKRYIIPLKPNDSLESIVQMSQIAQGLAYKTAIEHYRRLKWKNAGVAFWQFNDCWPGICFSIVDYYFEPKLSFQYIKQAYQPILISLNYNLRKNFNKKDKRGRFKNKFEGEIYIINDLSKSLENLELNIEVMNEDEVIINNNYKIEKIEGESCIKFNDYKFEIPSNLDKAPKIFISLSYEGKKISKNQYDLSYFDNIQSTAMAKLNTQICDIIFVGKRPKPIRYLQVAIRSFLIALFMLIMMIKVSILWRKRKKVINHS